MSRECAQKNRDQIDPYRLPGMRNKLSKQELMPCDTRLKPLLRTPDLAEPGGHQHPHIARQRRSVDMQMVSMPGLMDGNIGEVPQHSNSHRKARDGREDQGRHFVVSMVRPLKAGRLAAHRRSKTLFPRMYKFYLAASTLNRLHIRFSPKTRENTEPSPIHRTESRSQRSSAHCGHAA